MENVERKKPRPRRSFTAEFKAENVECCQRGHHSARSYADAVVSPRFNGG